MPEQGKAGPEKEKARPEKEQARSEKKWTRLEQEKKRLEGQINETVSKFRNAYEGIGKLSPEAVRLRAEIRRLKERYEEIRFELRGTEDGRSGRVERQERYGSAQEG